MATAVKCPTCNVVHYPVSVYTKWIRQYDKGHKSPLMEKQIARWKAIVEKHDK